MIQGSDYLDKISSKKVLEYVGDISQIADIQECRLSGGRAEGVRAATVSNGSGLEFTVLPDRGMDILSVKYNGIPLHYRTGTGVTSSAYFNDKGTEWLRSFYSGALTTCGLTYFGHPQVDQGKELGLHGRISNTPADDVGSLKEWKDGEYRLHIRGVLKEVSAFGENLSLTRSVETRLGQKGFRIRDIVRNNGYGSEALMMLYHFNFGFPLLNPHSRIVGPIRHTEGGDELSKSQDDIDNYGRFSEPLNVYPGRLFFHTLAADKNGRSFIALVNNSKNQGASPLAVVLRFDLEILPYLVEWKVMERQNYIVCLEPGNCLPLGREHLRKQGALPHIAGQEDKEIIIDYEILDTPEEIEKLEAEAVAMNSVSERKS